MFEVKDIPKIRRQLGLTQSELARLSGLSQSMIAKLEAGRIDPSYSKMKMLIDAIQRIQRKNSKKARDIMSTEIASVDASDTLDHAAKLMRRRAVSQLPVYEEGRAVGSVTEKTIVGLLSESSEPNEVFRKRVREVMEDTFPIVGEDTAVEVLYPLLGFFQAILVSRKDKIVGVVTKADLLGIV